MKVLLVSTGSRGDVEPFIALGRGLKSVGHDPTLAAPARFRDLTEDHALPFIALDDSLFDLQDDLARKGTLASLRGAAKAKRALRRFLFDVADLVQHPTDVVVYHPKTLAAPLVAEKQRVPAMAAQLIPLYQPTSAFPAPLLSRPVPAWLNRASWRIVAAVEAPWRSALREVHSDHLGLTTPLVGLAERISAGGVINAWSPHLLPAPAGWAAGTEPLGFWRLPLEEQSPPQYLVDFLDAGPVPVYVGFGSMRTRDPAALGAVVRHGLRRAGRRGIVATGAGAIDLESSDDILVLDEAPHDWLLPQVSVVVHHGGIGTVAAALTAGVPQVIRPFLGDQPFWGRRVQELQAGSLLRRDRAADLADAIVGTTALVPRCRALGQAMLQEDGVAGAIARIEHAVAKSGDAA